jgi:hypothetical protein
MAVLSSRPLLITRYFHTFQRRLLRLPVGSTLNVSSIFLVSGVLHFAELESAGAKGGESCLSGSCLEHYPRLVSACASDRLDAGHVQTLVRPEDDFAYAESTRNEPDTKSQSPDLLHTVSMIRFASDRKEGFLRES